MITKERLKILAAQNAIFLHAYDNPLNVGASATKATQFKAPTGSGPVEVHFLNAFGQTPFLVSLKEVNPKAPGGGDLMNQPVHHGFVFGTSENWGSLAHPIWIPPSSFLRASIENLSSALASDYDLVAIGRRVSERMPEAFREEIEREATKGEKRPYWLTLDDKSVTLSSSASRTRKRMTMPQGYALRVKRIHCESEFPVDIDLYAGDEAGHKLTPDGPIDSRLFANPSGEFNELFAPLFADPIQKVTAEFTELGAASNVVYFTLHGILEPVED